MSNESRSIYEYDERINYNYLAFKESVRKMTKKDVLRHFIKKIFNPGKHVKN